MLTCRPHGDAAVGAHVLLQVLQVWINQQLLLL